jgi:hypothetical protein
MLSQIGFFAAIIPVSEADVDELQKLLNDFVTGSLRIKKNKVCMARKVGGLGMIKIRNFISSLHCSWIKKAQEARVDNWRFDMEGVTGGSPMLINPANVSRAHHPILNTLANSFWKFKKAFYCRGTNFFKSHVTSNLTQVNNKPEKIHWDPSALCSAGTDISKLTIGDLSPDGVILRDPATITQKLGRRLNIIEISCLKTAIVDSYTLIKKYKTLDDGIGLPEFLSRFKKGSRPFRRILVKWETDSIRGKQNKRVKTFFEIVNIAKPEEQYLEKLLAQWASPFYSTGFHEFILKFRFNILGINTRVAHFNNNVSRACTFCTLVRREREAGPIRFQYRYQYRYQYRHGPAMPFGIFRNK